MRTLTIISDTFRQLRSRGMFWILLWISVLLVIVLGGFSCDETGWRAMYGLLEFESPRPYLQPGTDWYRSFHVGLFRLTIDWWIMSFALLLAMFPVTGIFPDMLRAGTIDFYLSKSVSRLGLFVGKYLGCLCVMLVQVSIVALGGLLVLFCRLGEWHFDMLWSIPLAVLIFSFVLCINVLLGVVTKSSIAALLWTLLFWGTLWLVQFLEFEMGNPEKMRMTAAMGGSRMAETMQQTHHFTRQAMLVLPKTRETGLLFNQLAQTKAPYPLMQTLIVRSQFDSDADFHATMALSPDLDKGELGLVRPATYVVGSSLLFSFAVLFLAYQRFRRMDF